MSDPLLIEVPESVIQDIARRVRDEVLAELRATAPVVSGYLTSRAAADYLGVSCKRIYDLKSQGAITPDGSDGKTPLYKQSTLDAYVQSGR